MDWLTLVYLEVTMLLVQSELHSSAKGMPVCGGVGLAIFGFNCSH